MVLLPHPEGPIIATISPGSKVEGEVLHHQGAVGSGVHSMGEVLDRRCAAGGRDGSWWGHARLLPASTA